MIEKKKTVNKGFLIVLTIISVLIIVAVFLFIFRNNGYRMIKVVTVENTSVVNRNNTDEFEAFEGLFLKNGDSVNTQTDGRLYLELDSDKHISAEPHTYFNIELAGKKDLSDARTKIVLVEGTINNVISKPLLDNETFEVETPTGTMAVRGTEFLVSSGADNNEKYAEVQVTKGKVEIYRPMDEAAGTVFVDAGKMLIIKESDKLLSDLVPWNIGEEPPSETVETEIADNSDDNQPQYEFGFSFDDFKFDSQVIDSGLYDRTVQKYGVVEAVDNSTGAAFRNADLTMFISTDGDLSLKAPDGTFTDFARKKESGETEFLFRNGMHDELKAHYSSPDFVSMSKDETFAKYHFDELNGQKINSDLSTDPCFVQVSEDTNLITIYEAKEGGKKLNIHFIDGAFYQWSVYCK